jgi:hypothetical protein
MSIDTLPTDILLIIINNTTYNDISTLLSVNQNINKFIKNNNKFINIDELVSLNNLTNPNKTLKRFPNVKFVCNIKTDKKLLKYGNNIYNLKFTKCKSDVDFSFLTNFYNLVLLDLSQCYINDTSLECISKNVYNLKSLNLFVCRDITNDGLVHVGKIHSLKVLNLGSCDRINDIKCLSNLINLEELDLSILRINCIDVLRNFVNLNTLHLSMCGYINDNELKYGIFDNLNKLKFLDLSWCSNITNHVFDCGSLNNLNKHVKTLYLSKNININPEALEKLNNINIVYR